MGLAEAVELARGLGTLPAGVIVHAVEGRRFGAGAELSEEVSAALPALEAAVVRDARAMVP